MKVYLKMDKTMTKVIFNYKDPTKTIKIEGEILEKVEKYIYLGQLIKPKKDHESEIQHCITNQLENNRYEQRCTKE